MKAEKGKLDALWADYLATGTDAARNKIAESYMPLVQNIANRLANRLPLEVDIADLVQVGVIGLMQAIRSFDASRRCSYSTFASKRVRGAMIDYLRGIDHVPRTIRTFARKSADASGTFAAVHGRSPTRDELRREMKIDKNLFSRRVRVPLATVSSIHRETTFEEGDVECESDRLIDHREPAPDRQAQTNEIIGIIIREFSLTDALFVRLFYLEGSTLKDTAKVLGNRSECSMSFHKNNLLRRLRARFAPEVLARMGGKERRGG